MTTTDKIKMLSGATAAVLEASTDRFRFFVTVNSALAEDLLNDTDGVIKMGVSASGNLWCLCKESDTRWVFPDKSLAVIA